VADDLKSYLVTRYLSEHVGHGQHSARIALRYLDVLKQINPKIIQRAKKCTARLVRANPKQSFWVFQVHSAGSPNTHTVKVSFVARGRVKDVNKMDVHVSCTCEHWIWWGPDFNAKKNNYLQGKQRSNGAAPNIRDPNRINMVCKHVVAASELFRNYRRR